MDTVAETEPLLTSPQAAEILRCSSKTVTRMALNGTLPVAQRLPGAQGAFLFRRSDVMALAVETSA